MKHMNCQRNCKQQSSAATAFSARPAHSADKRHPSATSEQDINADTVTDVAVSVFVYVSLVNVLLLLAGLLVAVVRLSIPVAVILSAIIILATRICSRMIRLLSRQSHLQSKTRYRNPHELPAMA